LRPTTARGAVNPVTCFDENVLELTAAGAKHFRGVDGLRVQDLRPLAADFSVSRRCVANYRFAFYPLSHRWNELRPPAAVWTFDIVLGFNDGVLRLTGRAADNFRSVDRSHANHRGGFSACAGVGRARLTS
jgi:hypothetical protein